MSHPIQPPSLPWTPGIHEDHAVIRLILEVCRNKHGHVFSRMQPMTADDQETLLAWPSAGLEQVGFATLVEAVRREARTSVLVRMSNDPTFREQVLQGDGTSYREDMAMVVEGVMRRNLSKLAQDAVDEVLLSLGNARGPTSGG